MKNFNTFADFKKYLKTQINNQMIVVAYDIQEDIKNIFPKKGGGRKYKKPDGTWHYASAPGEPPAIYSGRLKDSISVRANEEVKGITKSMISSMGVGLTKPSDIINKPKSKNTVDIGTRVPYSDLEVGKGEISARPYIMPIYKRNGDGYVKRVLDGVKSINVIFQK